MRTHVCIKACVQEEKKDKAGIPMDKMKQRMLIVAIIIVIMLALAGVVLVWSINKTNTNSPKTDKINLRETVKHEQKEVTKEAVSGAAVSDTAIEPVVTQEAVTPQAAEVVTPEPTLEPTPEPTPEPTVEPTPEPVVEQPVAEQPVYVAPQPSYSEGNGVFMVTDTSYFDDALFVGDSRTMGLYLYGTLKNATYFADTGMSAAQAATKVAEQPGGMNLQGMLQSRPFGKVYILFGINEISSPPEGIAATCQTLINMVHSIQPDAIVYIQANPHVTPSRNASDSRFNNTRINALNAQLAMLANNVNIFYIDVNELFDDGTGCMRQECSSDGIHLKARYYADWCNWLCTKAVPR